MRRGERQKGRERSKTVDYTGSYIWVALSMAWPMFLTFATYVLVFRVHELCSLHLTSLNWTKSVNTSATSPKNCMANSTNSSDFHDCLIQFRLFVMVFVYLNSLSLSGSIETLALTVSKYSSTRSPLMAYKNTTDCFQFISIYNTNNCIHHRYTQVRST